MFCRQCVQDYLKDREWVGDFAHITVEGLLICWIFLYIILLFGLCLTCSIETAMELVKYQGSFVYNTH